MQIVCVVKRTPEGQTANIDPRKLQEEVEFVKGLYRDGVVRQIWSRAGTAGAVLLLEVGDAEEAQKHVLSLPMAKAGILEIEATYPLIPYRGFGPAA